jgi:hypothetical protein
MEVRLRGKRWSVELKVDRLVLLYVLGGGSAVFALLSHAV